MKLTLKVLLSLGLFATMGSTILADCCESDCNVDDCEDDCDLCRTQFLPFSVGENRARDYAEVTRFQFIPDASDWNWNASLAVEYQRNFDRCRLGSYFFPHNNTLTVGKAGADGVDVRSVDLGLSSTFSGTLKINPKIQNWILEPALYLGLDRWMEGLYLWFKVPVVYTRWDLDCCPSGSQVGGAFFTPAAVGAGRRSANPEEALRSNAGPYTLNSTATTCAVGSTDLIEALGGVTFCDKDKVSECCRIKCCSDSRTGVADLPLHLGYNFINQENGTLGIYGRLVFPTGRRSHDHLFSPVIGYGRWQLGLGINGRIQLYEQDEETKLNAFLDVSVAHIFKKSDCRCFDMKDLGCMSRFTLLKEADANGLYTGHLVSFSDVFTAGIKTKFNWNLDGLLFLDLQHKAWNFDLGYELKHRDKEHFDCDCITLCDACGCDNDSFFGGSSCNTKTLNGKKYAVKGTLDLDGIGGSVTSASTTAINEATVAADATTVFITEGNFVDYLDLNSGRIPSTTSHKIWANIGYNWTDRDYPVAVGIFGEVEFGGGSKALRLWGLGAKAAVAYN